MRFNVYFAAGLPPSLNKYKPREISNVIKWDFISKAWFSDTDANPRRRIDSYAKEGLNDVVREVKTSLYNQLDLLVCLDRLIVPK